jgi:hypothetical protein
MWGAVWLTNPDDLLPLISDHLTPGGKLVFCNAPPVPGAYGVQGTYAAGLTGRQVWLYRWSYEPATWGTILEAHGYTNIQAAIEPAPASRHIPGVEVIEIPGPAIGLRASPLRMH